jgi:hypothetical protein
MSTAKLLPGTLTGWLLAAFLTSGLLTAFDLSPAHAQIETDPLTTSGLTVSELRRALPNQAICADIEPSDPTECFFGLCSRTCPEGFLGAAGCFRPASSEGRPLCGAIVICDIANACASNADCGPEQFCARTCCPAVNQCIRRCPEDNP